MADLLVTSMGGGSAAPDLQVTSLSGAATVGAPDLVLSSLGGSALTPRTQNIVVWLNGQFVTCRFVVYHP